MSSRRCPSLSAPSAQSHCAPQPWRQRTAPPRAVPALVLAVRLAMAGGWLATAAWLPAAHAQQPGATEVRPYQVPAGALNTALNRFAQEAGVLLSAPSELTAGRHSAGLNGSYTVAQGFAALLQSTDLQAARQADGSYALRRVPAQQRSGAAQEVATLPEVVVTAAPDNSGTTEGTGSYTQTGPSSTATGLGLTLRETPQSVSVVTRQQLEDQNLRSLGEAARHVTGITTTTSDIERTDIHSRGFHVDNYQYDGVPTNHGNDFFGASTFDTTVYDRIEFVRGATGLMTGAGNPGAAINLVRKRASSKTLTGDASIGLGSWSHRRGSLDMTVPLNAAGSVRSRVAATLDNHEAHLERYETRNRAFLATLEADLTPATNVRVGVDHQTKRPKDVDWGGLPMFFADGSPSHWRREFNAGAHWTYWNTTNTTAYAGLEHQLVNGWDLKVDFSRLERDFESKLLYLLGRADASTGLGISPFANYSVQDFTQNNGSIQMKGPFAILGRQHEAAWGLTSSRSALDFGNHPNTPAQIGDIFAWDGSYPEPEWGEFRTLGRDVTRQTGLYAVVRLSLTDSLKLIVGARQTRWKLNTLTAVRKHNELTPYAGLIFDIDDTYSFYASYADIFQPQDYRDASGSYLDPVIGKAYEAGVKAAYLDGRLNASLAAFRINQDNVAVLDDGQLVTGTTDFAYRGAKGVTSRGFEAELSGELAKGLQLTTGFARTLARNADGSRLSSDKPMNQLHVFGSYRPGGAWSQLKVGAGARWQSGVYAQMESPSGIARRDQGSFVIADLMLEYQITPQLSTQLNIDNLFDKNYVNLAGTYITYGRPRSAMLTMKYQF